MSLLFPVFVLSVFAECRFTLHTHIQVYPDDSNNSEHMQFSHHSQEVVFLNHHHSQVAMGNVVFPYHLFAIFILIPPFFSLVCLFP